MHQSIPPAPRPPHPPPPPPPGNCGAFARLVSPGDGAFADVALPGGRAFANPQVNPELLTCTRFPNYKEGITGRKADWLICQGQEQIVEGCNGMFSILHVCMHFFIAYQARIT